MDTRWSLFITIQFSLLLFGLTSSPPTFCHENERSALLEFKKSFFNKTPDSCYDYSTYKKIESWRMEVEFRNCCAWDGVECDAHNGYVIAIELGDSCLSGTISSNTTLFHLAHLQKLNLSFNSLTGHVPPQILRLTNLLSLDLSSNLELQLKKPNLMDLVQNMTKLEDLILDGVDISMPIPNILANKSSLRSFQLATCNLRGEFPSNIFKMPKLEFLDVRDNPQLSGHLPEFHWRSPLKSLRISNTNFSGQLPSSLGNLASLNELFLASNNFINRVPSSLGNLTQLKKLSITIQLTGEIPFWIRNLTQLSELSLSDNQMTGAIPSWIGQISNLEVIDLSFNKLGGEIPSSFVNLTQLNRVDMRSNQLSGQISPHLTKLLHLEFIDLSFNNFSGQIPCSITKLKNLSYLNFYSNNLNGTVHLRMFLKLKSLFALQLSFNKLSLVDELDSTNATFNYLGLLGLASCNLTSFPSFLQHQDGLLWVDLSSNNIYGEIPKWFLDMNIESLKSLNLSRNLLTSSPHEPGNFRWKALDVMDLRDNNLEGSLSIPPTSIKYYLVSRNKLSGELPPQICELSNVNGVDLDGNNLTGTLPQCLNNLSDTLLFLSLRGNNFYGEIPSLLSNEECKLRMLDLSSNHFQGSLPRSLSKCSELEFLNLGSNQIKDVFPSWLGSLSKLRVLILHSNEFHGPIGEPKFCNDFASLQIIDLSINNFSSCLPSKYFECWKALKFPSLYQDNYMGGSMESISSVGSFSGTYDYSMTVINKGIKMAYPKIQNYLNFVDLSMNNFTCEIPITMGSLVEVQFLNISNNKLIGTIPSFLKALTNLQALDLSRNKLHGKIPQELEQLNFLGTFNVSYNNLYGRIPQGRHFDTFNNESYLGNEELCGLPLSKKCDNDEKPLQRQSKGEGEESIEIDWKVVSMGYGSGLVIGAIIGWSFTIRPPSWILKYFGKRAYYTR